MKRRILLVVILMIFAICMTAGGFILYGKSQMKKLPGLSFAESLAYTTKDNPDAVISVGIIRDGKTSFTVYGENGKELAPELHTYEIGSITKTFTAALIEKAILEGKVGIDDPINMYLPLPAGNHYPKVRQLLTHTSGYRGYYLERPMMDNILGGGNDYLGITREMVLSRVAKLDLNQENYGFSYSNFGYAVLGLVLESVYGTDYMTLLNDFTQNDLGLADTCISLQKGDLGNYWEWNADDAYLAAGAITSNMEDMLRYAKLQLEAESQTITDITGPFAKCHERLETIDASTSDNKMLDINMDGIGMAWIIDDENGFIWHNGATSQYNSYLGFDPETGTAVVILSNLSPKYRIPATVLGVKLLQELTGQ